MNAVTAQIPPVLTRDEQLELARRVIRSEGQTLLAIAERLDDRFCSAIDLLLSCQGSVIVTGMGKAGLVGQKIAATLASTGTRSHFVHPAEAVHGDLGRFHAEDIALLLSKSGQTEEIVRLLPSLAALQTRVIAITGNSESPVADAAAVTLTLGNIDEVCTLGLAPSASTTAMMALGDALALVASRMREFTADDFGRLHPAGSLGRQLSKVEDVMRPIGECRVALETRTVREIYVAADGPRRRVGALLLTNSEGKLTGIFTDSDLARLLERRQDAALDAPIQNVMSRSPTQVAAGTKTIAAIQTLSERSISELPVVDRAGKPLGLIDITDVIGMLPKNDASEDRRQRESAFMMPAKAA